MKAVTNAGRVFRLADPLGAASVNVFEPSWEHAWHFDEAEFTVTLSLQCADGGGDFECTEPLRQSEDDLAYDATAAAVGAVTKVHGAFKVEFLCAQRGARVLLYISAKFRRNSR